MNRIAALLREEADAIDGMVATYERRIRDLIADKALAEDARDAALRLVAEQQQDLHAAWNRIDELQAVASPPPVSPEEATPHAQTPHSTDGDRDLDAAAGAGGVVPG